jgi:hypothetical protein
MAVTKRTKTEREAALAEIAQLDRQGWTTREIAAHLHVSQSQVMYDLKALRRRYAKAADTTYAEKVEYKRQQLRDVLREAFRAWHWTTQEMVNSLAEKVLRRVEVMNRLKLPIPTTMELTFGFVAEADFLRVIMDALKAEMKLDGLTEGDQTNLYNTLVLDWSSMVGATSDGMNELDEKIAAMEKLPPKVVPPLVNGLRELPAPNGPTNGNAQGSPHP